MTTIRFKTGANFKGFRPTDNVFQVAVQEDVLKRLTGLAVLKVRGKTGSKFIEEVQRAGNTELRKAATFAANLLIGRTSPTNTYKGTVFDTFSMESVDSDSFGLKNDHDQAYRKSIRDIRVSWPALSPRTMFRWKTQNKNKFFLHQGALRKAVAAAGPAIQAGTGGVVVQLKVNNKEVEGRNYVYEVAEVKISIAPSITPALLPGLLTDAYNAYNNSMKFERKIFRSVDIIRKLQGVVSKKGADIRHRPLMQPVVQYFLQYRVPRRLAQAIDNSQKQFRVNK